MSSGVFSRSLTVCSGVCCYKPWLAELLQLCGVCSEPFSAGLELSWNAVNRVRVSCLVSRARVVVQCPLKKSGPLSSINQLFIVIIATRLQLPKSQRAIRSSHARGTFSSGRLKLKCWIIVTLRSECVWCGASRCICPFIITVGSLIDTFAARAKVLVTSVCLFYVSWNMLSASVWAVAPVLRITKSRSILQCEVLVSPELPKLEPDDFQKRLRTIVDMSRQWKFGD